MGGAPYPPPYGAPRPRGGPPRPGGPPPRPPLARPGRLVRFGTTSLDVNKYLIERSTWETDLESTATEDTLVQDNGVSNKIWLSELDVGVTLWLAGELVEKDGDTVDGSTAAKVCLNLLWRCAVVDVAHEDAPAVNVLLALTRTSVTSVEACLHLTKLGCFRLHLLHTLLHLRDLFLASFVIIVVDGLVFALGGRSVRHAGQSVGVGSGEVAVASAVEALAVVAVSGWVSVCHCGYGLKI